LTAIAPEVVAEIVIDTSALMSIMLREPTRAWLLERLSRVVEPLLAAPTALEFGMVLEARIPGSQGMAARTVRDGRITVVDFTADLADRGLHAWRRFGKGRHPAALNFGDCCTYALAEQKGLPILCVGNDFARTDLPVIRPPD
jgi:ribonuclease VapC